MSCRNPLLRRLFPLNTSRRRILARIFHSLSVSSHVQRVTGHTVQPESSVSTQGGIMKGHRMSSRTHRVIALLIGISLGWSGLTPHQLSAQPTPTPTLPTKDRGLFFSTGTPGEFYEAPMLKTDVEVQVHGTMLHATVRQQFMNPSKKWLEGI